MVSTLAEVLGRSTRGPGTSRLRDRLVVAEIAVSLVLLIGAGLLIRSLDRLLGQGARLRARAPARGAGLCLRRQRSTGSELRPSEASRRLSRCRASRRLGSPRPFRWPTINRSGRWVASLASRSMLARFPIPGSEPIARLSAIDGAYAMAMGIALKTGRTFTVHDHPRSLPVAMVNDAFVRRYFSDREAVGSAHHDRSRDPARGGRLSAFWATCAPRDSNRNRHQRSTSPFSRHR